MAFALEVKSWLNFEVEKTFDDQNAARHFGVEQYPQNDWRVRNTDRNVIVYQYDPLRVIEQAVQLEIGRFQRSEDWVRQRQQNIEQAARMRERLSRVANQQRRNQRTKNKTRQIVERVNWMVEGF